MEKTRTTTFIIALFRLIPLGVRRILFKSMAVLFYYSSPKQRLIAMHNLMRAFPEKPLPELVGIAKRAYRSIGILAAEFFEIPYITKENIDKYVVFDGLEHVQTALAKGKGLLSVISHFGNWEMMPAAFPIAVGPTNIVYRPLDSPILENLTSWVRTAGGNDLIAKDGAVLRIARLLARKKIIGILIDQNMAVREGTFVNFFGRPACTTMSLAFLALKTGAPVLPAFMVRMQDGRYRFLILPEVEIVQTGDMNRDIITNTQKFNDIVEGIVRKYPMRSQDAKGMSCVG